MTGLAVGLLGLAAATIAWFGRSWFFFHDEWGIIFYRRQGGLSTFFAPVHGHLFAGVIAIYRVLFATVGLGHYGVYRGVEDALHILCAALLYLYARRRGVHPVLALLVLALFAFLGAAWEVLFWLASAGFVIPMIVLLATLLVWDSGVRGANAATAALATVALGTYTLGAAVVAGLVICALGPGRSLRRLAALVVPLAAWGVWFVAVRPHLLPVAALRTIPGAGPRGDVGSLGVQASHVSQLPLWLYHSAIGSLAGVVGEPNWTALGVGLALLALAGALRQGMRGSLEWRFWGLAFILVSFWVSTGLARSQSSSPAASRYVYPAAVVLLLLATECLRDVKARTFVLAGLAVMVCLAVVADVGELRSQARIASAKFARERIILAQLESCRGLLPVWVVPDPRSVKGVTLGPFWAATADLGNPVPPLPRSRDPLCPSPPAP